MDKKKEKSLRRRQRRGCPWGALISIGVLLGMLVPAVCAILAIRDMYMKDSANFAVGAEAELMASGLAIIGLAIAVWTGLSIANAIRQREVQELKETMDGLAETAAEAKETVRNLDPHSLFLQEFLKTNTDYTSTFLYYILSDAQNICASWNDLMLLERMYTRANKMHQGLIRRPKLVEQICMQALDLINEIQKEQQDRPVRIYLLARTADFNWFLGYSCTGAIKAAPFFCRTLDAYLDLFRLMGIDPNFTKESLPQELGEEQDFIIYITNTLSLCYIRLAQKYDSLKDVRFEDARINEHIAHCSQKAVQYGRCARTWVSDTEHYKGGFAKDEFYHRNLGVAYELLDKNEKTPFAHADEAFACYQAAFGHMAQDGGLSVAKLRFVCSSLLGYYKKYLDCRLDLGKLWAKQPTEPAAKPDAQTLKRLEEFRQYADFALREGRRSNVTVVMHGFAWGYTLLAVRLYGIGVKNFDADAAMAAVNTAVADLRLLGCTEDNYWKQLLALRNWLDPKAAAEEQKAASEQEPLPV